MDSSATPSHNHQAKQCHTHTFHLAGKHPPSFPHHQVPSFSSNICSSSSSLSSSSSPHDRSMNLHHRHDDNSLLGPATPLRLISRVPFSWEHFPGIPKNNSNPNCNLNNTKKLLPLPPPTTTHHHHHHLADHQTWNIRKKNSNRFSFQRDPFFAAFVECSKSNKDDHDHDHDHQQQFSTGTSNFGNNNNGSDINVAKVSRSSLSDRFGFISLYASCKRTCAVSESLVHLPSSRRS